MMRTANARSFSALAFVGLLSTAFAGRVVHDNGHGRSLQTASSIVYVEAVSGVAVTAAQESGGPLVVSK